jgi:hypothetical protein
VAGCVGGYVVEVVEVVEVEADVRTRSRYRQIGAATGHLCAAHVSLEESETELGGGIDGLHATSSANYRWQWVS